MKTRPPAGCRGEIPMLSREKRLNTGKYSPRTAEKEIRQRCPGGLDKKENHIYNFLYWNIVK